MEVEVIKNGDVVKGKTSSITSDSVTITSNNEIIKIRQYDKINIEISENISKPRLTFNKVTSSFTLGYLLNNIKWICVATILIWLLSAVTFKPLRGPPSFSLEGQMSVDSF
jgi:hypothetical protein